MKKKNSIQKRKERRMAEIAKAHAARFHNVQNQKETSQTLNSVTKTVSAGYHELPLKEIKKDMIKNFAFLVFAVAVIIVIKLSGFYIEVPV